MSNGVANEATVAHFAVKVDGTNVEPRVYDDALEIVVETTLNMPDMATIKLHDAEFHWIDNALFTEGKKVEISAQNLTGQLVPVFSGEIVGLEMDLSAIGTPSVTVRCFDKSHRLHRGRKARSFLNVKDSDLASQLGQEVGLRVQADQTAAVHEWLLQNNQTNWEFLVERAAINGFRIYCADGDKLKFERMDKARNSPEIELNWGESLRSFRLRMSVQSQVAEVEVRSWDHLNKQTIISQATSPEMVPEISHSNGPGKATSAFGRAKMVVVDHPFPDAAQADVYAKSVCDDMGGTFIEAEGLCYGHPEIRSGTRVKIANIGSRFSGKYYVTSATHTYTPGEGFSTLFVVSGKRSQTLLGLVDREDLAKRRSIGSNPVIGIVTNNDDPEGLNRVKVKYPWLTDEHESFWARQASQMAGADRGFYSIPEINDEVLVIFEHGDISRPIVVGALWSRKDKNPDAQSSNKNQAVKGGSVNRRGIRSRVGHYLEFDDTDGNQYVRLASAGRNQFYLLDHHEGAYSTGAAMVSAHGHSIMLNDTADCIVVSTKTGQKITLKDSGEITVEANASIKMSAPSITLDAAVALNLKGATVKVNGTTLVEVQGAIVRIN